MAQVRATPIMCKNVTQLDNYDKIDLMEELKLDFSFFRENSYIPFDLGKWYITLDHKEEYRMTSIFYDTKDEKVKQQFLLHRYMLNQPIAKLFFFFEVACFEDTKRSYFMYKFKLVPKTFYAKIVDFSLSKLEMRFLEIVDMFETFEQQGSVFADSWSFSTPIIDEDHMKLVPLAITKLYPLGQNCYVGFDAAPTADSSATCTQRYVTQKYEDSLLQSIANVYMHRASMLDFLGYLITLRFRNPMPSDDKNVVEKFSEKANKLSKEMVARTVEPYLWNDLKEFLRKWGKGVKLAKSISEESNNSKSTRSKSR